MFVAKIIVAEKLVSIQKTSFNASFSASLEPFWKETPLYLDHLKTREATASSISSFFKSLYQNWTSRNGELLVSWKGLCWRYVSDATIVPVVRKISIVTNEQRNIMVSSLAGWSNWPIKLPAFFLAVTLSGKKVVNRMNHSVTRIGRMENTFSLNSVILQGPVLSETFWYNPLLPGTTQIQVREHITPHQH